MTKLKKALLFLFGYIYINYVRIFGGLKIGKKLRVIGVPIINLGSNSFITLGSGVVLNSFNDDYHVNMYGPVKLYVEGKGSLIEIGDLTRVHGSCLHARKKIAIGKRCLIAANCNIVDSHGHKASWVDVEKRYLSVDEPREIIIEDDVWIGCNVLILPGVRIGKGAIISANSVVKNDVAPFSIVCGNPAVQIFRN